jgi:hypothetical protein
MAYSKSNYSGFFSKGGFGDKLIGAGKGLAGFLDNPLVQGGISVLAPEIGAGLTLASKAGILQKIKDA